MNQQKAMPAKADQLQFKNLKVLPPDIARDDLIAIMRTYARSLGVRCEHCHVQNGEGPDAKYDFPSDAKPEKDVARTMMRMTTRMNADYISKVNEHGTTVTCYTCHRGKVVPESTLPPPPPAPAPKS
ncbi:MAG TPA: c-type cytochrome [Thermoanaerobaculia bacterium]|nr:c-type cytochrome [Thermoanaerobaculia bacterium]